MPYPRELLDSAQAFLQVDPQTQATLRRAVSTAYYALFHFLVEESCANWVRPEQRPRLARVFEHRTMNSAASRRVEDHKNAPAGSAESHLYSVAYAFKELQLRRHVADYDLSRTLTGGDVAVDILLAEQAFSSWGMIRDEQIAQDYLFALLFRER